MSASAPVEPLQPFPCPVCGAAVPAGAPWCGQCYATVTAAAPTPAAHDGRTRPDDPDAGPASAVVTAAVVVPTSAQEAERVADALLLQLAATREPAPTWLARLPASGPARAAVVVGAALVGMLVVLAALTLVGALLS